MDRRFHATLHLNNAEAVSLGDSTAVAHYLRQLADRIERDGSAAGVLRDGNGNAVGRWAYSGRRNPNEGE